MRRNSDGTRMRTSMADGAINHSKMITGANSSILVRLP
jgi:hypothetical protein